MATTAAAAPGPRGQLLLGSLGDLRRDQQFDAVVYRMIAARRRDAADRGDLMSILLHAQDADDGSRMTDRHVRDEVMTLFLAGHETTARWR